MEKTIIEAHFTGNKLARILLIVGIAIIPLGFFLGPTLYPIDFSTYIEWFLHHRLCAAVNFAHVSLYIGILLILVSLLFFWLMSRCALTITNRRVTGKASFGKFVDLPLHQISAVGLGAFSSITIATSSGSVHFWFVANRKDVHTALSELIGTVQGEKSNASTANNTSAISNADELKKFKELLDEGVITQEEFDAKKKQLLGL